MHRLSLLLIFSCTLIFAAPHQRDDLRVDEERLVSLDRFDGLSQRLTMPMGEEIDPRFFVTDHTDTIFNGRNHVAEIQVQVGKGRQSLAIQSLDGIPGQPVLAAVALPGGGYRNFIITLDEEGSAEVALDRTLRQLRDQDRWYQSGAFTVLLASGLPFGVDFSESSKVEAIEVEAPQLMKMAASATVSHSECLALASASDEPVYLTAQDGTSVVAIATVSNSLSITKTPFGDVQTWENAATFKVDYPLAGNAYHQSRGTSYGTYIYNLALGFNYCDEQLTTHRTYTTAGAACNFNRQEHDWTGLLGVFNNNGTGTATAISGCQAGGTWSITKVNQD